MTDLNIVPMRILQAGHINGVAYRKNEVAGFTQRVAKDLLANGTAKRVGEPTTNMSGEDQKPNPSKRPPRKTAPKTKPAQPRKEPGGEGYETK